MGNIAASQSLSQANKLAACKQGIDDCGRVMRFSGVAPR